MSREFTRQTVMKFLQAQFPWIDVNVSQCLERCILMFRSVKKQVPLFKFWYISWQSSFKERLMKRQRGILSRPYNCLPYMRSWGVILRVPGFGSVYGLAVNFKPISHLFQTILENRVDPTVWCRSNVHQQISTTAITKKGEINNKFKTDRYTRQYTFLPYMFCFPNLDHVMFSREFALCILKKNGSLGYHNVVRNRKTKLTS